MALGPAPSGSGDALQVSLLSHPAFSASSDRLEALYADFSPLKTLNPSGYSTNVSAWSDWLRQVLARGLQRSPVGGAVTGTPKGKGKGKGKAVDPPADAAADLLVLRATDDLLASLRRPKLGVPYGLPVSLQHLTTNGRPPTLIPLATFLSSPASVYAPGWGRWLLSTLVGKPLWWGLATLGVVGDGSEEGEQGAEDRWRRVKGSWVHLPLVAEAGAQVLRVFEELPTLSSTDRLFTRSALTDTLTKDPFGTGRNLSSTDVDVLLRYLERDRRVLITEGEIVKFAPPAGLQTGEHLIITEADRGVVSVRTTIEQLEKQVASIETQIAKRTAKAKAYISTAPPHKALAAAQLRSRKDLTALLDKRLSSLSLLRQVLTSLDQASGDAEVLAAYERSARTLKAMTDRVGGVGEVEKVADGLQNAVADAREVEEAMRVGQDGISEDELAEELQGLVLEAERGEEAAEGRKEEGAEFQAMEARLRALKAVGADPAESSSVQERPGAEKEAVKAA